MTTPLFRQYEISEEKKVDKATDRSRSRTLARYVAILSGLTVVFLLTFVILPPAGYAAFPGANGKIAFDSDRDGNEEVYVMNADGSGQTNLSNNPAFDGLPVWSSDGTKITFSSMRDGNFEVYLMNADGTGQTNLTNNSGTDYNGSWSPDGEKIVFTREVVVGCVHACFEIFVMNADGTGQTRLTYNSAYDDEAVWSPDGTKIAFSTNRTGGCCPNPQDHEIFVMNPDGSGQTNITNNSEPDGAPDWSPDGTKIVFNKRVGLNHEIFVMNADGSNQTNLTNSPANEGQTAWSPDGMKIAFASSRDGNSEIYVMNADGSSQTNLTNNPASDAYPDWQPLPNPCLALEDISDSLQAIIDNNQGTPLADKVEDALAKTQSALAECTKTPPDNQAALGNIEGAVGGLEAAVKDGLLDQGQGTQLMNQLAAIARALAVDALDLAIAQGGDPVKIGEAQQALATGDALRASGAFKDAVNKYKDALAKAESALP